MNSPLTTDQRFNKAEPLVMDHMEVEIDYDFDGETVEIRDRQDNDMIWITLRQARALRDWLNKVLP